MLVAQPNDFLAQETLVTAKQRRNGMGLVFLLLSAALFAYSVVGSPAHKGVLALCVYVLVFTALVRSFPLVWSILVLFFLWHFNRVCYVQWATRRIFDAVVQETEAHLSSKDRAEQLYTLQMLRNIAAESATVGWANTFERIFGNKSGDVKISDSWHRVDRPPPPGSGLFASLRGEVRNS